MSNNLTGLMYDLKMEQIGTNDKQRKIRVEITQLITKAKTQIFTEEVNCSITFNEESGNRDIYEELEIALIYEQHYFSFYDVKKFIDLLRINYSDILLDFGTDSIILKISYPSINQCGSETHNCRCKL